MNVDQVNTYIAQRLGWKPNLHKVSGYRIKYVTWTNPHGVEQVPQNWATDLHAIARDLIPVIEKHKLWNQFTDACNVDISHPHDPFKYLEELDDHARAVRWALMCKPRKLCEAWLKATEGVEL